MLGLTRAPHLTKPKNMLGESVRLNDNEIRDITKLLEAGKPLPDRYRFLLFDDKREVDEPRKKRRHRKNRRTFGNDTMKILEVDT